MAEYSYNGWLASPNPDDFGGLSKLVVAGESFAPGVRGGDVFTVLQYVAEQLNARVEPIYKAGWHEADDWGYSYRPNTNNKAQISCHGSGTAIDYNATRHPNGSKNTWTAQQYAEIDKICAEVSNVVRQLKGYDEMHFEICADARAVNAVALRLRKGVTAAASTGPRLLQQGSSGDDVRTLQTVLSKWYPALNLVVDGVFGPATASAVRQLQRNAKLEVDGIVGPDTRKVLGI